MEKFPKIKYPNDSETDGLHNDEVVVTEKLDGANFRFTWDEDGNLAIGTRNVVYRDLEDNEDTPKAFRHAIDYLTDAVEGWIVPPELTFYGEAMHLHSLQYEDIDYHNPPSGSPHVPLESDIPNVVLFDIQRDGEWVDWDEFEQIVSNSPFESTRVLERGDPEELSFEVPEQSMFGGPPEGIVARRVDGAVRAKKVTEDFKEQNAISFNDPSKAQSDAAEFVAAYVTEPRIEKTAHKLVDEGEYDELQMQMMQDLPREVCKDIGEELFWSEFLSSGGFEAEWDDDFKNEVRSKASTKCARVLKQEVQDFA